MTSSKANHPKRQHGWLFAVAAVPAAAALGAWYTHAQLADVEVDVDTMLDVSVSIQTVSHVSIDSFGDSVWKGGAGSGFLVSAKPCRVWTNHHVVEDAAIIRVQPRGDAAAIPATLVASTRRPDIAVLELEHCEGMPVARLGESSQLRVGQQVYAVGNPFGRNPDSVSSGILSHLERYTSDTVGYLQTDASINPGNSGGALFNARGEVVGVNTAIAAGSRDGKAGATGIGYALPIDLVRSTVNDLGGVEQGWGDMDLDGHISNLSAEEAAIFGLRERGAAVVVTTVIDDGPAAEVLEQHDIIVDIAGSRVHDRDDLKRLASTHTPGSVVQINVLRDANLQQLAVTLSDGRDAPAEEASEDAARYNGHLGMTLENWHERDDEVGHIQGPVIARVHDLGPAHVAGIQSSQRGVQRRGPYVLPVQLSVSTLTGVVFDGEYRAVASIDEVEALGRQAFENGESLLVELELWMREKNSPKSELTSKGKAFYAISPHPDSGAVMAAGKATPAG